MTERHLNRYSRWIGSVVNLQDPDQEGKIQVRVFGVHDDTANIPDSDLLWMKPLQDITSSGNNKMGKMPVGVTVGSVVGGYWLDSDKQHGVFDCTIAKAGDLTSNTVAAETNNGQAQLVKGTNSTPVGGRTANNAFQTRNNKTIPITQLDTQGAGLGFPALGMAPQPAPGTPSQAALGGTAAFNVGLPKQIIPTSNFNSAAAGELPESNDSDAVDVTGNAVANTKYANNPSTGSVQNPSGSILTQITKVDPQFKNSVLPNAVPNFIKIKDLDSFSSPQGAAQALGQMLGAAMSLIGPATALSAIAGGVKPGELSNTSVAALLAAIQALGTNPSTDQLSEVTQSIIGQFQPNFIIALQQLINSGNLNAQTLEELLQNFLGQIMDQGQQATLGGTSGTIMNQLGTLLPQIAPFIDSVLNIHLPTSVLDQGSIQNALQSFALNQAIIKSPNTGKKQYAVQATSGALLGQISSIQGVPDSILSTIKEIILR